MLQNFITKLKQKIILLLIIFDINIKTSNLFIYQKMIWIRCIIAAGKNEIKEIHIASVIRVLADVLTA